MFFFKAQLQLLGHHPVVCITNTLQS